ncbi:Solute carrier family 26 member 6 [Lemmus lemmus]
MELQRRDYRVERPLLDQEQLEDLGHWGPVPKTYQWRTWFRCSRARAHALLLHYVPVLGWLPRYPVRDWLLGDLLSGLSVAIMQLPQGTFAVMSVMVGGVTESLTADEAFVQGLNATVDDARVQVAYTLSFLVGLFQFPDYQQVGLGLVHFGFVVTYLSEPLVRSYTTAASVQVLVSQLKYVFGIKLNSHSGPLSVIYVTYLLPQMVMFTSQPIHNFSYLKDFVPHNGLRFSFRILPGPPSPNSILSPQLIGATGISFGAELRERFQVDVVGNITTGLIPPVPPKTELFATLVGNAFAIAVVGFAIAISLGNIFALRHGYRVDSNQELVALGLSNLIGSFFQCFPVSCSMSRSLVQEGTGGNTQVAGAVSSLFILLIIVKLGELFRDLPKAVLAAVIIVNLKGMMKQFSDICSLWKANRVDLQLSLHVWGYPKFLILLSWCFLCLLLSIPTPPNSLLRPHYSILGQVPDTDIYRDVAEYSGVSGRAKWEVGQTR